MSAPEMLVALAGNPNAGKTTLFNELTGAHQHVGNYPGITVEKKEGVFEAGGKRFRVVDLPGTYSLTAYSPEELVARHFIVNERPRVVLNIVDASNLERNLYLTLQIMELGVPVIVALNMVDVAEARGVSVNARALSERLGAPVIPIVARTGRGMDDLIGALVSHDDAERGWASLRMSYGGDVEPVVKEAEALIAERGFLAGRYPARWTAVKYLEADEQVIKAGREADPEFSGRLEKMAAGVAAHLRQTLDTYPEAVIADHRYGFIAALLKKGVVRREEKSDRLFFSDQADKVLTNRFFGPLIMLGVIYVVYQFTFTYSEFPVHLVASGFSALSDVVRKAVPEGLLQSLLASGIIDGVGGIVAFIPLILLMFCAIAFLEDTGYLARMAFMLDRIFRVFGLHGSSVMAYIIAGGIAGGCAVPGVMATRTLRSSRERLATILTAPFMNCGAKVPVFAMLIVAFFPRHQARMMFLLTILSWVFALALAKVIRLSILRGPSTPFLLELPPYRLPTFKGLAIHTWERTWQYGRKAGTLILAFSILAWALMTFPGLSEAQRKSFDEQRQAVLAGISPDLWARAIAPAGEPGPAGAGEELSASDMNALSHAQGHIEEIARARGEAELRSSVAGRVGTALETVTRFCGFDWHTNIALLGGFAAKELIISTFGTAYSLGNVEKEASEPLSERLARDPNWSPLRAFALMVFIMLYSPCLATVICIVRESGTWKWGLFSVVFNTVTAFLFAVLIYRAGSWLGMGF